MDISFIYIILKTKHTMIDRYYILTLLLIHLTFIIGLIMNMKQIIDICHVLYSLSIIIGTLLIYNKNILKILIILLLIQVILKTIFGECIMYTSKYYFFKDLFGSFIDENSDKFELLLFSILLYKILM